MKRFSWMRYVGHLLGRSRITRSSRSRQRPLIAATKVEGLESRWLLSGDSLSDYVLTQEIAPGAVIEHRDLAYYGDPTVEDSSSLTYGPRFGGEQLNGGGLQFHFTPAPGMSQVAIDGFQAAADLWSAIFSDDIVINMDINFAPLGPSIIGQTGSSQIDINYSLFRAILTADATSASDLTAVANLQSTAAVGMLLNMTDDSPNGSGNATPYFDNNGSFNNTLMTLTTANAKAAGVLPGNAKASDAQIEFNSDFDFDFDRSDGITPGFIDFVGVAAHEIGHCLGFTSGVDRLDVFSQAGFGPFPEDFFAGDFGFRPLDLFRYSSQSIANGTGVFDFTADTRAKYFSIDGGQTPTTATFATGQVFGDGNQASHWKDNLGIGIMDPTAADGELLAVTNFDKQAFDVIGWDLDTGFGLRINQTDNETRVAEAGTPDTYTIFPRTGLTGPIDVTVTADGQTEISTDGVNYFNSRVLTFTSQAPQTIAVRAIDDTIAQGNRTGTITHRITASSDPNYPTTLDTITLNIGIDDNELRPFERVEPTGSLISISDGNVGHTSNGVINNYVFFAQAGEKFAAEMSPDSNVLVAMQLVGVSGTFTSPSAGAKAVMTPQVIPTTGMYTIRVTASATTDFDLTAYLNTALESSVGDTSDTNKLALGSSLLPIGGGRLAVVGSSDPTGASPLFFSQSFNPGLFLDISGTGHRLVLSDDQITSFSTTVGNSLFPAGDVTVSNNGAIVAGLNQSYSYLNEALPSDEFTGAALLPFWDDLDPSSTIGAVYWEERLVNGIETLIVQWDRLPHYTGTSGGLGAVTFQVQLFATGPVTARYAYRDVNFGSGTYNNGVSATIGYQIDSFFYDQFSFNTGSVSDGTVLELKSVVAAEDVDSYTVDLTGKVGQRVDISLASLAGANFTGQKLELVAPDGTTVLATGSSTPVQTGFDAANVDLAIQGFVVPANGIYTVRLTSAVPGDYSIVVTEQMAFETEPNDLFGDQVLRDISGPQAVLGYLDSNDAPVFTADFSQGPAASNDGFTIENYAGGLWHRSTGRSDTLGHSGPYSFYFGQNEGSTGFGDFNTGSRVAGRVTSPPIDLTSATAAQVSFKYLLETDESTVLDIASVLITTNGGASYIPLVQALPESHSGFTNFSIDLSAFVGNTVQIRFNFDSVNGNNNDFEGWYLDDFVVSADNNHPSDLYQISATAGQLIVVSTQTPFDAANGGPLNNLNPAVQIIHPNGTTVLFSDLDSAADGKNASLSFTAPITGVYLVRVVATSGTGEYVLKAGIDVSPPLVTSLSPPDNSINVPIASDLTITFNKAVLKGGGNILLKNSSNDATIQTISVTSTAVTVAGNVVSIALADMASSTGYYVVVPSSAFTDVNGNPFAGITSTTAWNFTTADVLPPVINSLTPPDDATNVNITTNLGITFNETVVKGAGTILIKKTSDGSTVQTIDVTSASVTVAGAVVSVDIADLASSTGYFVQIAAGAFVDLSANAFTGISSSTAWNFTTGDFDPPLVVTLSPPDNSIDVSIITDLAITFNENVVKGSGNILIKRTSDDVTVQTIPVTGALVSVTGAAVTVDLSTLAASTSYYVVVPNTAFRDSSNNAFAGISGSSAWNFTTSANIAPTIVSSPTAVVTENTSVAAVVLDVNGADLNGPSQILTYTLSGPDAARFNIDALTGEIRFVAVPDFEAPVDQGANNIYNFTVTVTDDGIPALSASQALTITVVAVNDNSPVISSAATASVPENTSTAVVVLDVNATDADLPSQTLTYSLSGPDAAAFSINATTGEIRFVAIPNFEAPADQGGNNVYDVTVTVTDSSIPTRSTTQGLTISVTNANDNAPIITSTNTATVAENTSTSTVVLDVNATDTDLPSQVLNYSLSGPDAAAFTINGLTGEIRFVSSPDFEVPTDADADHVYVVTVTVTDNGSPALTATQALSITVTATNDNAPQITSAATATIAENSPNGTVVLDVNATDADQPGQSLTYSLSGPGAAFLNINSSTGEITFAINLDYENPADTNGDNVYEVTVVVTDNGTPSLSTTQNISLTVTPVNDNTPIITSGATATVPENTPTTTVLLDVNATDADLPASSLSYSLSGPDASLLTIDSATGEIRFLASPNFESPVDQGADHIYQVTVTVTDNDGISRTASQSLTIIVTPVNDNPPIITSVATATIAENSPASTTLIDVEASDGDLPVQSLSYSLSGPDAGLFNLNSVTGILTFLSSPNFEQPGDQGANNVYNVTVTATDSGNPSQSTSQLLTVTVTNVNETPADLNLSTTTVSENQPVGTLIGTLTSTDVDAGDTFAYSLVSGPGSADNGLFAIVGSQLRTASTFDFEARSSYSVRIRTTDAGGLIFEKSLTITITDANDTPTDIALSSNVVAENQPAGSPIGSLTTTDQDPADTFTYSLVAGIGDNDNASFIIVGDQIQTAASFNFEAKSGYSIRVRSTDAGGQTVDKVFAVFVINVNEQPTNVVLTKSTIAENLAAGTSVGSFITTDQDNGDSFSYQLVSGPGSEDNASFTVFGGQLLAAETFNFESRSSYSIRVRATDQGGLFTEQTLTISILNVNELPTAINLSSVDIPETQPAGFKVGTFTTTDFDLNDTFTYSLVLGTGSIDNDKFEIVGDELRTTTSFDFETKSAYSIRVRSRDSGGQFLFAIFIIQVTNANEAPIDVTLAPATLAENQPANSLVGTFNTTDGDLNDTFTYQLIAGLGSTNNSSFTIVNGQLRAVAPLNFEAQSGYAIRVRSTDSGGLSIEKALTVNVGNVNEAPTDIALSATSVAENKAAGTLVGNLSSSDPDIAETFTYALVAGQGSDDNGSFTISNGQVRTAASFDFETNSTYTIRIRSTDAGGLSTEKPFTINVTGVNEPSQDMTLSPTSVAENLPAGTVVGTLNMVDGDVGDTFTFTFVSGVGGIDNASFVIDGNQIKTTAALNFESKSSYSIRVRGTDGGGLSIERAYSISVLNVNEPPATLTLSNASIAENQPANTQIGTFDSTDPDSGDVFTYALVSGAGSTDNAAFVVMGDRLLAANAFDFETKNTYSIRVRSTDSQGLSIEQTLTINVTNRSDPPVIELTPGSATVPNGKGGLIDVGSTVTDQDSTNFQNNRLVVAVQAPGQSSDRLRMLPSGKGPDRLKATKTQLKHGKTVIGTVSGGRSGVPLTITFTQAATAELVQQVLRQMSFKTHGTVGDTRHIDFQMFDGTGDTSGPVTKEVVLD